ncbi:MAG TPA: type I DNA topoisomerase [Coxiellaceae bacterium]|nr:type I DNA topoisomerase [Coxiellaceae bacterium]
MSKNVVVVESPAKAKTIEKYLGKDFQVLASYGHVRDLLPKKGSVDPENGFAMRYEPIEKNAIRVDAIKKALKKADTLYLATDPDREGEAIAWHIYEMLSEKGALKNKAIERIVFHEITKSAVQEALSQARTIDMNLVNAQQARRALDYLVGFNLSPLLWKKIRRGLSAGRVQSPALRLIVEREAEIDAFKSQEYWTIEAACAARKQPFPAKLIQYQQQKLETFSIQDQAQADSIKADLSAKAQGKLTVVNVDKKTRKRNAAPPFMTSTLQQEAAQKLGFTAQRTMRTAQQLYEGIETDDGPMGLITYMRTDSANLAKEAVQEIRDFIQQQYGDKNLPDAPNVYKTKSKNAQEAHEAIRPTSAFRTPASLKNALTQDQVKLYDLIWKRTIASQMIPAKINTVSVDLSCGDASNIFRATGSTIIDPGFMSVYQESLGDDAAPEKEENLLPELTVNETIDLLDILGNQHFTEPPPRYSEATLIKALEEYGIGRPSTYAAIISTLQHREYVILEKKRFHPTDTGKVVNKFLTNYFTKYVDYTFTAGLEDELDAVARGEMVWVPLLKQFWEPFHQQIATIEETVQRKDVTQELLDEACPKCGKPLSIRLGRAKRFIGCTGYPDCDYTRNMDGEEETTPEPIADRVCPQCGGALIYRQGRYGKFIGCSQYPKCKFIESLVKPADTEIPCPECFKGTLLKRRSRRGTFFYSCSRYPECKYATWNEPIAERCPDCGWPILTIKTTKKNGTEKVCPQKNCGYHAPVET